MLNETARFYLIRKQLHYGSAFVLSCLDMRGVADKFECVDSHLR